MNAARWALNKNRCARYNRRMSPSSSLAEQFLIAMPGMQDPHFARTVSLICQHDAQGAMGLVLNQDSEFNLGELFDQLDLECRNQDLRALPVLSGGPVQTERGFILHQDSRSWDSSMHLANGLTVTTSRDILEAIAVGEGPAHAVVALGCAGWGAGQLEFELGENSWLTAPVDAELLFAMPLAQRWQAAGGRIGIDITRVTDYSGHA